MTILEQLAAAQDYAAQVADQFGMGDIDWNPLHSPLVQGAINPPPPPAPGMPQQGGSFSQTLSQPVLGGFSVAELAMVGGGVYILAKIFKGKGRR